MVCKVVIVDDESIIRRGISATIQSHCGEGFEIVGAAANGYEGKKLIEVLRPDIVITDIKMPLLSGIEMMRQVRDAGVAVNCIFMSGFDEFEYVKAAMDLKAESYLLKPIKRQELIKVLADVAGQLEQARAASRRLEEEMPERQQAFLSRLLAGNLPSREWIVEELRFLDLQMPHDCFTTLLFFVDQKDGAYDAWALAPRLCEYAVCNIAQELLSKRFVTIECTLQENRFALIVNTKSASTELSEQLRRISRSVVDEARQHLSASVMVAVGRTKTDMEGISISYREAGDAMNYCYMMGKGRVIEPRDVEKMQSRQPVYLNWDVCEKKLLDAIKLGSATEVERLLDAARNTILWGRPIPFAEIRTAALSALAVVFREFGGWSDTDTALSQKRLHAVSGDLQQCETVDEIFDRLLAGLLELASIAGEGRDTQRRVVIKKAKKYIETHFSNQKLSLQSVAVAVHVSPSYLSTMFKKECDIHFVEYLTEVRMREAKRLLCTGLIKMSEIAQRVGYANPQYFSLCFKKHMGYPPTYLRKQMEDGKHGKKPDMYPE